MRAHYFFMKFLRSFLIGFGCAMAAILLAAMFCAVLYFVFLA